MPSVIQIVRVSTADQAAGDRAGIDRQLASCAETVARRGLTVVHEVALVDVSGSHVANTPEWGVVVALLRSGAASGVVVDAVDRLLRADAYDYRVFSDLAAAGAVLYTRDAVRDLRNPDDGFMSTLLAAMGGREKREMAIRARQGKEAKRKRGEWICPRSWLPLGVDYDRTRAEGQRWSYTPAVAEVVEHFQRYARGDTSVHAMAVDLGTSHRALSLRLRNDLYRGWLVITHRHTGAPYASADGRQTQRRPEPRPPSEVIRVQVLDPPAVDDATWTRVQSLLADKRRVYSRSRRAPGAPNPWPLRGMLRCARCGSHVDCKRGSKGPESGLYACAAATRGGIHRLDVDCDAGSVTTNRVHRVVVDALRATLTDPAIVERALRDQIASADCDDTARQVRGVEKRLVAARKRRERALALYLDGDWTPAELADAKNAADRAIADGEAELARLRPAAPSPPLDVAALAAELAEAMADVQHADGDDLRAILLPLRLTAWIDKKKGSGGALRLDRLELDVAGLGGGPVTIAVSA